ncbi:hypothetical protein L596_005741 [Steinernema carpocapsae]|uniref:Ubiquitin-like protease family profile domain-containing protein n=1 Tax=Steinernema carpocapsae TaxID=34508 RepID=A0A4U8V087_STECR|nr:hypothetical protein L596_005741 [Steinernema carpocapsae]
MLPKDSQALAATKSKRKNDEAQSSTNEHLQQKIYAETNMNPAPNQNADVEPMDVAESAKTTSNANEVQPSQNNPMQITVSPAKTSEPQLNVSGKPVQRNPSHGPPEWMLPPTVDIGLDNIFGGEADRPYMSLIRDVVSFCRPRVLAGVLQISTADKNESLRKLLDAERWLDDAIVYDFLRIFLPNRLIVDPIVWSKGFHFERHGVMGSRADLGDEELVFMPFVINGNHWVLALFDVKIGKISYVDSNGGPISLENRKKIFEVARLLWEQHKPGKECPKLRVGRAVHKLIQQQQDESSCGPLVCLFAMEISCNMPLQRFNSDGILRWRRWAYGILKIVDPPPAPGRHRHRIRPKS